MLCRNNQRLSQKGRRKEDPTRILQIHYTTYKIQNSGTIVEINGNNSRRRRIQKNNTIHKISHPQVSNIFSWFMLFMK
jgi:hypothetical protein